MLLFKNKILSLVIQDICFIFKRNILIYSLLIHCINGLYAQRDTTKQSDSLNNQNIKYEYDTVYIAGDTVKYTDTVTVYLETVTQPRKQYLHYGITLSCSPFYSIYQMLSDENEAYLNKIRNIHQSAPGVCIHGNFLIGYKNFFLEAGAGISTFSENFKHITHHSRIDTSEYSRIVVIERYITIDENNDTLWHEVSRKEFITQIDTTYSDTLHQIKNHFKYYEVPVGVGFHKKYNRFTYEIKTGIIIGNLYKYSHVSIPIKNWNTIYKTNDYFLQKRRINSFFVNISANYLIKQNIWLQLGLSYRYGFNSFFRTNYYFEQKNHSPGVLFGIRYNF